MDFTVCLIRKAITANDCTVADRRGLVNYHSSSFLFLCVSAWSDFHPFAPQDLKEEGQVLQVGSLGPRWVLVQHAEPWLLTVTSKPWSQSCVPSDKLKGHIFSIRKRSRREVPQETEEPPAKKSAAEKREGEEKERVTGGKPRKKLDKEPQKKHQERTDEGSKDKLVNVEEEEEGKQMQSEEGGEKKEGQEKVEVEKKGRGKEKELGAREDVGEERDEASSPPAEPAGDDE